MARIRLNQEYRNKIANRIKVHLQQEDTQEKRKYDTLKADQIDINDQAWSVAEKIVRRHYTEDDVEKAYYLQNKFENVSTIAKDSCFHFHYLGTKEKTNYDNEVVSIGQTGKNHQGTRMQQDMGISLLIRCRDLIISGPHVEPVPTCVCVAILKLPSE